MATCVLCQKESLLKGEARTFEIWGVSLTFCKKCVESLRYKTVVLCNKHQLYVVDSDTDPKDGCIKFSRHCIACASDI